MTDPQQQQSYLAIWLMLIFAGGAFYVNREPPFEVLRPIGSELRFDANRTLEDVDARLWEDPFVAVSRRRAGEAAARGKKPDETIARDNLKKWVANAKPKVLVVPVSSAGYAEDIEIRRRHRVAVQAGLKAVGYMPRNSENIGYYVHEETSHRASFKIAARAAHLADPSNGATEPNGSAVSGEEKDKFACKPDPGPAIIPFERYIRDEDSSIGNVKKDLLVLWVPEDVLLQHERPLCSLATLLQQLKLPDSGGTVTVLGPERSSTLRSMAMELRLKQPGELWPASLAQILPQLEFLSASATVDDPQILRLPQTTPPPPGEVTPETAQALFFKEAGIHFRRVTLTDRQLAGTLARELEARGVRITDTDQDKKNGSIALITELDTLYGQSFDKTFSAAACNGECAPNAVRVFSYFRGLDGETPDSELGSGRTKRRAGESRNEGESKGESASSEKTARDLERAEGNGQFDYLRRLADAIKRVDRDQRKEDQPFKAIGVMGNDVHDKLLILQALRPEFPADMIYFTTDYDARFLHPSERRVTRNLIVASAFDLSLRDELQAHAPPFRSSYQTAVFLATQLALAGRPDDGLLDNWFARPRLFEIGNTVAFPLSAFPRVVPGDAEEPAKSRCTIQTLDCKFVHPPREDFYPKIPTGFAPQAKVVSVLFLIIVAIVGVLFVLYPLGAPSLSVRTTGIAIVGSACLAFLIVRFWNDVASALTDDGYGHPFIWFEGIGVWPVVALRLAFALLAGALVLLTLRLLKRNMAAIAKDMVLHRAREDGFRELRKKSISEQVKLMFSLRDIVPLHTPREDRVLQSWMHSAAQGRTMARLIRAVLGVVIMFAVFHFVAWIFGRPTFPYRGGIVSTAYLTATIIEVIFTLLLLFIVADATLNTWSVMRRLRKSQAWPMETIERYAQTESTWSLAKEKHFWDEWADVQFILKRTTCILNLIYLPFLMLSLLILTRTSLFGHFAPSVPIAVSQIVSFGILACCIALLRIEAENARTQARKNLGDAIVKFRRQPGEEGLAARLEDMLKRVEAIQGGAFSPLTQQPIVKAMLLPLTTWGGTALLSYLPFTGL